MTKSISFFLALALAAAAFVAGCGSSDDTTTSTSTSSTASASVDAPRNKAEYIKQADAICEKSKETRYEEARAYRSEHLKELNAMEPIPAEEKILRAIVLPAILKEAKELRAIEVPRGEEKKIEEILSEMEAGANAAKKNPYAIELEVPTENPLRKVDLLIRAYGFDGCRNV
jgi:hypothetical protein